MAGNPNNANVWAYADVLIAPDDESTTIPQNGEPFGPEWDYVGLLNGDDGFTESINVDNSDHFAWGGILVATSRSNFKLTRSFTAFEANETVYDLVYPGHDVAFDGSTYEGDVNVPDLQAKFKIAFQTKTGETIQRVVSRNYAQVGERGDAQESETSLASRQITVDIYPTETDPVTGKATLFYTYKGPEVVPSP